MKTETPAAARPNVGFVGLGDMGGRIARRIVDAGFPLTVYDSRPEPRQDLRAYGAAVAEDIGLLARGQAVVGICVVNDQQLQHVVADLRDQLSAGAVVLVHSSVMPSTVVDIAAELAAIDVAVIDAPVSGSRPAADAGTLTVMAGGEPATIDRVRPVLDAFAANVVCAGGVGAGQALKIANNIMLHMNHLVALEAVRFARAAGVDERTLIDATNLSSGRSWVTETWGLLDDMITDHPLAGTESFFPLMSKELWHGVELGRQLGTTLPLTALGSQVSEGYFRERAADLGATVGSKRSNST